MKPKRLLAFLLVFVLIASFVMPTASAVAPPTTGRLKATNCSYSSKVLNVSTWGTPASGNNVTLWAPTGSQAQSWYNVAIGGSRYRLECYYQDTLALNHSQATGKCTVYTWSINVPADYKLLYGDGLWGTVLSLTVYGYSLGGSGVGYDGAQLYWLLSDPYNPTVATKDQNWTFTHW